MSILTKELQMHWAVIQPLLTIQNEREYDRAIERLHDLIAEVGSDEQHPSYGLLDTLGAQIHAYEEQHYPVPAASGADVLQYLMEEHGLAESDLPEVGAQAVMAAILRGERELDVQQIRALARRFGVSPAVFL